MVDRLARCGQRSVAPLVDISNYVMFELGRPSHIFDLDKIHGGLQVRWGKEGEQLKLLNRSEEHTSELQSPCNLVCRLLLEKKKNTKHTTTTTYHIYDLPQPSRLSAVRRSSTPYI